MNLLNGCCLSTGKFSLGFLSRGFSGRPELHAGAALAGSVARQRAGPYDLAFLVSLSPLDSHDVGLSSDVRCQIKSDNQSSVRNNNL